MFETSLFSGFSGSLAFALGGSLLGRSALLSASAFLRHASSRNRCGRRSRSGSGGH